MDRKYDERLLREFIKSRCGCFSMDDKLDVNDFLGKKYKKQKQKSISNWQEKAKK